MADLTDILAWYASDGALELGLRHTRRILERIERLADHPEMGRMVPEFGQRTFRELIYPPFRIAYRHDPDLMSRRLARPASHAIPIATNWLHRASLCTLRPDACASASSLNSGLGAKFEQLREYPAIVAPIPGRSA